MAKQLKAILTSLAEDLNSVPSGHTHTYPQLPNPPHTQSPINAAPGRVETMLLTSKDTCTHVPKSTGRYIINHPPKKFKVIPLNRVLNQSGIFEDTEPKKEGLEALLASFHSTGK